MNGSLSLAPLLRCARAGGKDGSVITFFSDHPLPVKDVYRLGACLAGHRTPYRYLPGRWTALPAAVPHSSLYGLPPANKRIPAAAFPSATRGGREEEGHVSLRRGLRRRACNLALPRWALLFCLAASYGITGSLVRLVSGAAFDWWFGLGSRRTCAQHLLLLPHHGRAQPFLSPHFRLCLLCTSAGRWCCAWRAPPSWRLYRSRIHCQIGWLVYIPLVLIHAVLSLLRLTHRLLSADTNRGRR